LKENLYRIKENSWLARIAARKLNSTKVAIVLGNTIYLYNTGKETFLKDERWLKHELCHIKQFREHGFFSFIAKYLWESLKNGYYNNKYEVAARTAENL
jgi:hypothetical protein